MNYKELIKCRNCKSTNLEKVLELGDQHLTGVFPKSKKKKITKGPLSLLFCVDCTLLQLAHSYDLNEMYGETYGYRSGLNDSMVSHLNQKIKKLELLVKPNENDVVLDIGSNDATSLNSYSTKLFKIGIDPSAKKFKRFYKRDTKLIIDFFSRKIFSKVTAKKAKIITSIAMFYDLEDPNKFVKDIYAVLDDEGVWHFEQSYMPSMIKTNAYDTICHEHLEFYSLKVINELLIKNNFKIVDIEMNAINGGSFAITAAKKSSGYNYNEVLVNWLLSLENEMNLSSIETYQNFARKVFQHKNNLFSLIKSLVGDGKRVIGYGASTKGNVILQYCGFNESLIPAIAEVNPEKFGSFTPGSNIPIISENEAKKMKPDYFLVFPWHFKHNILEREKSFINQGGKFIFPLPEIEIV